MSPVVFRPPPGLVEGDRNAVRLSQSMPTLPLPISEGHMVMAYANALAQLGVMIGHGEGEVAPEAAHRALREGLARCLPDARKDLAAEAAAG